MASAKYPKFLEACLDSSGPNLDTADIRVICVDVADYTYSASHDFLDDVPGGARVGTSGTLQNTSVTNGVFDADDITITGVSGDQFEALVLYCHDGGADTARRLIAYIDTASGGGGISITPDGGNIVVSWDNGSNKILAL